MLKIYNTLSRQIEDFKPITKDTVNMYVCGPTVYNYIHIGNARSVVAFDLVRRYLEYRGFKVNYVSNFTDVDDKIISAASEEGISSSQVSEKYIRAFYEDIDRLQVSRASANPRATKYIDQMIDFTQNLIEQGVAYESEGDVYFRVDKATDYGKLAGKNLEELLVGASGRIDDEVEKKESPADFALWKSVKSDREEDKYESPWGSGRPGWHLECSVMSTDLLGDTLDIHGGGQDLEFPHHTNEIAQSEAKTGKTFVNYWMHNGFVNVEGEKMSKSLGNFKTVHEMLESGLNPQTLRFFLVSTHYRRPLDFTDQALELAENNLKKIENAYRNLDRTGEADPSQFSRKFQEVMDEDFNIANGLAVFYDFLSWVNSGNGGPEVARFFEQILELLGLKFENQEFPQEVYDQLVRRKEAKDKGDFVRADQIREDLKSQGIGIKDTAKGSLPFYE